MFWYIIEGDNTGPEEPREGYSLTPPISLNITMFDRNGNQIEIVPDPDAPGATVVVPEELLNKCTCP